MDTTAIIVIVALLTGIAALVLSALALASANHAKHTADEAKRICEQNAVMLAKIMEKTDVKPEKSWLESVTPLLKAAGAVAPFLALL